MTNFETNKKNFKLLPISIVLGVGCLIYGAKDFEFKLQPLFLIAVGIFLAIGIPIYAIAYQKQIEINHKEKFISVLYPILKKRVRLTYDQINKIRILKNIYASQGMYYDEIIIYADKHKIKMKSNEMTSFSSLENKLKHELKDKIEIL